MQEPGKQALPNANEVPGLETNGLVLTYRLAMESAETARKADDSYGWPRFSLIGVLKQEGPLRRAGGAMASLADWPPYKRHERSGRLAARSRGCTRSCDVPPSQSREAE